MPLGQAYAGFIAYQIAMIKLGWLDAEGPIDENLPRC